MAGRQLVQSLRRAAVLGHPVDHSLSPALHRSAYADLGLTHWRYDRRDVQHHELAGVIEGLGPEWVGLSLTMPLKQTVLPLLDDIDPVAAATGSVNTVLLRPDGRSGVNTDVAGIVAAIAPVTAARIDTGAVLGGGATACSAIAALHELGATEIAVHLRDITRDTAVRGAAEALEVQLRVVAWPTGLEALLSSDVVVSTTPAGTTDALAGRPVRGNARGVLLDVVYDPWPTGLAGAWRAAGGVVVDGFEMLVHQAAAQVRLMTGLAPDVTAMRHAGLAERATDGPSRSGR